MPPRLPVRRSQSSRRGLGWRPVDATTGHVRSALLRHPHPAPPHGPPSSLQPCYAKAPPRWSSALSCSWWAGSSRRSWCLAFPMSQASGCASCLRLELAPPAVAACLPCSCRPHPQELGLCPFPALDLVYYPLAAEYYQKYAWAKVVFSLMPWCPLAKAAGAAHTSKRCLRLGRRPLAACTAVKDSCLRLASPRESARPLVPCRGPGGCH